MNDKPHISFVAPHNYPLLAGRGDLRHIGGAEVQRKLLAGELLRRGHRVSFVTADHGQPDGCVHEGVRVFKMCRPGAGLPGLRFLHPRWTSLWAALNRADPDIVYQRTAGAETGQAALWCARKRRTFVLGIANEPECDWRLGGRHRPRRERWLYRYGLRHAHAVIAQTRQQQQMLRANFGLTAALVRSCAPLPEDSAARPAAERLARPRVLWIGRFSPHKRLDWVLALARRSPHWSFDVVGAGGGGDAAVRETVAALRACPNVGLHGFLPHAAVGPLYDRAAVLLSTSRWEGFPNVFLEAWSRGVPTVSTLDPDDLVRTHDLGRVGVTLGDLAAGLHALLNSEATWRTCARNAREYFRRAHTVAAAVDAFEAVLATVWRASGARMQPAATDGQPWVAVPHSTVPR